MSLSISICADEDNTAVVAQLVIHDDDTFVCAEHEVGAKDVNVVNTESIFIGLFCWDRDLNEVIDPRGVFKLAGEIAIGEP